MGSVQIQRKCLAIYRSPETVQPRVSKLKMATVMQREVTRSPSGLATGKFQIRPLGGARLQPCRGSCHSGSPALVRHEVLQNPYLNRFWEGVRVNDDLMGFLIDNRESAHEIFMRIAERVIP